MAVSIVVFSILVNTYAEAPKVKKMEAPKQSKTNLDGWYEQEHFIITYYVDTKSQLCFARLNQGNNGQGFTVIDSEKLKRREEWKNIITW